MGFSYINRSNSTRNDASRRTRARWQDFALRRWNCVPCRPSDSESLLSSRRAAPPVPYLPPPVKDRLTP